MRKAIGAMSKDRTELEDRAKLESKTKPEAQTNTDRPTEPQRGEKPGSEAPSETETKSEGRKKNGVAIFAVAISVVSLTVSGWQLALQVKLSNLNAIAISSLVDKIYARKACTSEEEKTPSLDCEGRLGCPMQCPPANDLRIRHESARLMILLLCSIRGMPAYGYDYTDIELDHASLPWFTVPKTDKKHRADFYGTDLRCADFNDAHFKEVSFRYADLRGAHFPDNITDFAESIDWRQALCPDGTRAGNEGGCTGHMKSPVSSSERLSDWELANCKVDSRPTPNSPVL